MFTHVTACTLAGPPEVIRYIEGFSYFVTSITAPIASGWSEIAGWDSHPLGKRRLCKAHANSHHSQVANEQQVHAHKRHSPLELPGCQIAFHADDRKWQESTQGV